MSANKEAIEREREPFLRIGNGGGKGVCLSKEKKMDEEISFYQIPASHFSFRTRSFKKPPPPISNSMRIIFLRELKISSAISRAKPVGFW